MIVRLSWIVKGGERFIKHQHARVGDKRTCQGSRWRSPPEMSFGLCWRTSEMRNNLRISSVRCWAWVRSSSNRDSIFFTTLTCGNSARLWNRSPIFHWLGTSTRASGSKSICSPILF